MIGDQVVYEPGLTTKSEFAKRQQIGVDDCPVNIYGKLL